MLVNGQNELIDRDSIFLQIDNRILETKQRISEAALRSGRSPKDVLLVAVSKYAEPDDGVVEGFLRAGVGDLAENRPQKFLAKVEFLKNTKYWNYQGPVEFCSSSQRIENNLHLLRWHFIGNLQRNKVRRILPYVSLIHSIDSWKLLETIERILQEEKEVSKREGDDIFPDKVSALLEVHISEDETKQGFTIDEVKKILAQVHLLKHIEIVGLMGMAGLTATPDETRRQFAKLRETLECCQRMFPDLEKFRELSMGMSGDFEIAIEEGATIVRIGSSLYPERG